MELVKNQYALNQKPEETNEESLPIKENEDQNDVYEYDYDKRLWF